MRRCVGWWRGLVGVCCKKIGGLAVLLLVLDMVAADCRLVSVQSSTLATLSVSARSSALATRIQIQLEMEWKIEIKIMEKPRG